MIQKSFIIFKGNGSYNVVKRNDRRFVTKMSKRKEVGGSSRTQNQNQNQQPSPSFPLGLRVSNPILAKSAVAVFGLGFIDAG